MKDEAGDRIEACTAFAEIKAVIDDWIDYYNNERCAWNLAKLPPNECWEYWKTGAYPNKDIEPAPDRLGNKAGKTKKV